jgi:SAM-dependent methyltransferase
MSLDSIECCRVLELGCGTADNLIAMAFQFPGSEFVGIDLGRVPIASGQALVTELGMRNVTLLAMDLCDPSLKQFGEFSFIIVHGVYSWVPQSVRERILQICQNTLTTQGIAYISYNAYPVGHFSNFVHTMIAFPTRNEGTAEGNSARALVASPTEDEAGFITPSPAPWDASPKQRRNSSRRSECFAQPSFSNREERRYDPIYWRGVR